MTGADAARPHPASATAAASASARDDVPGLVRIRRATTTGNAQRRRLVPASREFSARPPGPGLAPLALLSSTGP